MSYEVIKSYLLVILIGISVLLTVALWTYQPNYEQYEDPDYVNEVNVGGEEQEKKNLIHPSLIMFHDNQSVLGFEDVADRTELLETMSSWVMYDAVEKVSNGPPTDRRYMEIIYPTEVPGSVMSSLFTFNEEINPPNWSFDRIYVTFDSSELALKVHFNSVDRERELVARIDKRENYDLILNYVVNHPDLIYYSEFTSEENSFYAPDERLELSSKTLVTSQIQPEKFVDALFINPSGVTPNVAEAYFTDGQRGMNVTNNRKKIEFINPIQENVDEVYKIDLLEQSIANINEHKGWTNDHILESINTNQGQVKFRLTYDNFPVYDMNDLTEIEQKWRGNELYEYSRSLIRLTHEVNSTQKNLLSGTEVMNYIEKEDLFNIEEIEDLRVGYKLEILSDASDTALLEPNWYVKSQANWYLVNLKNQAEGGE